MKTPHLLTRNIGGLFGGKPIGVILCVTALLLVQGCRPEEQEGVKFYEPGVYKGAQDEALDEATLRDLQGRAMEQQSP